jgi:putative ABC transport system permease protein
MNLAWSDIRYKFGRFVLTCLGLGLLLAVVITMAAMNRGQIEDAVALVRAIGADLWVVEGETVGPFAESSRIPADTREMIARIHGVAEAGSITLQNIQLDWEGRKLRLQIVGYEPGRPGGPTQLVAGREIMRSHYELIADRQTGLRVGQTVRLGRNDYTVVGETRGIVTLSGDSIVYVTLRDAQQLQFQLTPPAARREAARGAQREQTNLVNAVIARLTPGVPEADVAETIRRWRHFSVLTDEQQQEFLTRNVIQRARQQLGTYMVILGVVSAVIIALIIYSLTMDKIRGIAMLKLIGAPDRTIVGLILQQALLMGVIGFVVGTLLVYFLAQGLFVRRLVMLPEDIAAMFGAVIVICILASLLGVRAALRVDPAQALVG